MHISLKKFDLDHSPAYQYFFKCLNNVNELSTKIIEIVDFNNGKFFTFLNNSISSNQIYKFKNWDVADKAKSKTSDMIYRLQKSYKNISVIFDNFNSDFPEISSESLFIENGFHYKKEVYYLLDNETISQEKIAKCFYFSDIIWHSLCVLSKVQLNKKQRELSEEQIKEICEKAQLILVEAYDGESYIFWKRNDFVIDEFIKAVVQVED